MLARIISAIIHYLTVGFKAGAATLDWLLTLPSRLFGGSQPPLPSFEPEVKPTEVVQKFEEAREKAAQKVQKSDIERVKDWLKTHKEDRATKKLPASLPPHVIQALMTMSEDAITRLSRVEEGYLRRFLKGGMHAICGVPEFQNVYATTDKVPDVLEEMRQNVRKAIDRNRYRDRKIGRM